MAKETFPMTMFGVAEELDRILESIELPLLSALNDLRALRAKISRKPVASSIARVSLIGRVDGHPVSPISPNCPNCMKDKDSCRCGYNWIFG